MTKKEFKNSIRYGKGSAILELKKISDIQKYKDIIAWACLNNTCYDMQSEGERSQYLYDIISMFDNKTYFENLIIQKYIPLTEGWLQEQLSAILYRFALEGSEKSRSALYNKYNQLLNLIVNNEVTDSSDFEWTCIRIMSLDGFSVFENIVKQVGESISKGFEFYFDYFYTVAKEKFGSKKIINYMTNNTEKVVEIKAFYNEVTRFDKITRNKRNYITLEEVLKIIFENDLNIANIQSIRRFLQNADYNDKVKIANIIINEQDINKITSLMRTFYKTKFPLSENYLLPYLKIDNSELYEEVINVLSNIKSITIRNYALDLLKNEDKWIDGIILLKSSYTSVCEKPLADILHAHFLKKSKYDDDLVHYIGYSILSIFQDKKKIMKTDILEFMYNLTPCSSCRYEFFILLYKYGQLSNRVLEEGLYDSYEDTRKYAKIINEKIE